MFKSFVFLVSSLKFKYIYKWAYKHILKWSFGKYTGCNDQIGGNFKMAYLSQFSSYRNETTFKNCQEQTFLTRGETSF